MDRAYSRVTANEVAAQQAHLTKKEQANLEKVLAKYSTIFDGKLRCNPHKKIKLDIPLNAQPIWKKLYPIPYRQETTFKKETEEMVDDGVLRRKHGESEWSSLTFV